MFVNELIFAQKQTLFMGGQIIEPGAIIYPGCYLGPNSIVGTGAVLKPNTFLGENSIIGSLTVTEGNCKIGDSTTIHAQCHITQGVTIGKNVFIGPFFIATNTPRITGGAHGRFPLYKPHTLETTIEDDVRMGANVHMIPGLTVGQGSIISQDTLLTKDVPAWSIVKAGKDKVGRIVAKLVN